MDDLEPTQLGDHRRLNGPWSLKTPGNDDQATTEQRLRMKQEQLPKGASQRRQAAAMAPAEAPDTFFRHKSGAYLRRQATTPTW